MRIVLLCPKPQRRGAELFSRELAEDLRRRGHEILEIYLYPAAHGEGLPEAVAQVDLAGDEHHWLERLAGWHPAVPRRLRRALRQFEPDVVQANGGRTVKYAALVTPGLAGSPLLVYRNIGEPAVWVRGWRRKLLYSTLIFPRVNAVATIGEEFLPALRTACSRADAIHWIPRGINVRRLAPTRSRTEVRAALDTPEDAPVTLFLGRLSPEKRVDRLLRAFAVALVNAHSAVLWIAGSGPLDSTLLEQAEQLGCAHRCRFLGVRDDVGNLIAASDIVALSSDTEGAPHALREAAALGRPVVATRAGATGEIVLADETGFLVELEDEDGFARALTDLLTDSALRARLGAAAARNFERTGLSTETVAHRYESLYLEAMAARTPAVEAS